MQIINPYHSKIISALEEVCEKNPRISKYDKPQIKLNCCKKNCDCVLKYEPDFCISYKPSRYSEQLIIFEIIDAQDEPTTIADLIRIKLSDQCRKAFFVYPDETKDKMVRMVLCTVLSNFKRLFGESSKRKFLDAEPILIPKDVEKEDIVQVLSKEVENALP